METVTDLNQRRLLKRYIRQVKEGLEGRRYLGWLLRRDIKNLLILTHKGGHDILNRELRVLYREAYRPKNAEPVFMFNKSERYKGLLIDQRLGQITNKQTKRGQA